MADNPDAPVVNGDSKGIKKNNKDQKETQPKATPEQKPELSNAEKKKLQKQEKQERRAKEKAAAESSSAPGSSSQSLPQREKPQNVQQQHRRQDSQDSRRPESSQQRQRRGSSNIQSKPPVRPKQDRTLDKRVGFFSHLYGLPRRRTLEGTPKEVHPAISALAMQLSSYVICGSHARGVAMLLALKTAIKSYTTPHGTSLPRHMVSHYLTPQLTHIKSARPFSMTQANSIRWLKNIIANIDPSAPEERAKQDICAAIDTFISERFTVADQVIADSVAEQILDHDVVAIYGKSAVVQSALLAAFEKGRRFSVVVVDSRPLFEGKASCYALSNTDLDVEYVSLHGLDHAMRKVTKCLLGAHTVFGNGRVYSRAGTALVAMMAKAVHAEVIVCAETIKFTEKVALDSIINNELAPEDELVGKPVEKPAPPPPASVTKGQEKGKGKQHANEPKAPDKDPQEENSIRQWREKQNLYVLNPLYDVTPIEYIDKIVTELGSLPPSSAPAVQRLSTGV